MTSAELLSELSNIGSALSGLGVVVGGGWGLYVYLNSKKEDRIARFKQDIGNAELRFSGLAADFQNQIVATLEELFRPGNIEAERLLDIADKALALETLEAIEKYLSDKPVKMEIHERLLYSLSGSSHGLADKVRCDYKGTIDPIIYFSPVVHLFFKTTGSLVLTPYQRELNVLRLDEYFADAIKTIWSMKKNGEIQILDQKDVRLHIRGAMSAIMAAYSNDYSLVAMISRTLDLVTVFTNVFTNATDDVLWATHKEDRVKDISLLDKPTHTDTLRAVIQWKFRNNKQALDKCISELDDLEQVFKDEDK